MCARVCAQVGYNRGVWVRVRASILAQAQVRTTGRARVRVRVCAQVGSGANVAQSNRGECRTISDYPTCVRACVHAQVRCVLTNWLN